jgi:hypothetical protein
MESARTKDGVHVTPTAEANKYSQSELALMKTQDVAYLRAKATAEAKVGRAALGRWRGQGVGSQRVDEGHGNAAALFWEGGREG